MMPTMQPTRLEDATRQAMEALRSGRLADAEAMARQVLAVAPSDAAALHCLGLVAQSIGRSQDAIDLLGRAAMADPFVAEYHYNLSVAFESLGQLPQAEAALRAALRVKPDLAPAHLKLGAVLFAAGRIDEAIISFNQSVQLRPLEPWGYLNLGKSYRFQDKLDQAEAAFRKALVIAPDLAPAWNMLGSCLRTGGRIKDAIDAFARAVQLDPKLREAHSNLCYALYFDPQTPPQKIFDEHLAWARKFADPVAPAVSAHPNDRAPDRRLRIAYVSPNLRRHVVGLFMLPIIENHDWEHFEVTCYSDVASPDDLTARLKSRASVWRDTRALSDEQLANLVREDGIDILVDVNLHMRGCRLGAFARKPAPVQITHLAYCGTSGLSQMDFCITDPHMMHAGCEVYFKEWLLPMAESYWCYRPPDETPPVGPPPMQRNGYVTFGSLNTLAKVNDQVIQLWAKLLERVPNSRLAVHIPGGAETRSAIDRFVAHGIRAERLLPVARLDLANYMDLYNQIDIALDPFPYGGGTTTLDALWMGVPVVTLAGQLPVGRAGVSILSNLQLLDLIAQTKEQYLNYAAALAADPVRLTDLRSTLRDRMQSSPLLDAPRYVRNLEAAYRQAWQTSCDSAITSAIANPS